MPQRFLQQFENRLESLEAAVLANEPLSQLCQLMQQAMLPLLSDGGQATVNCVELWLQQGDSSGCIGSSRGDGPRSHSSTVMISEELIRKAVKSAAPLLTRCDDGIFPQVSAANPATNTADCDLIALLMCSTPLSDFHHLICINYLELTPQDAHHQHEVVSCQTHRLADRVIEIPDADLWNRVCAEQSGLKQMLCHAVTAVTGCVAERVSRMLLTGLFQRQQDQAAVSSLTRELHQARGTQRVADLLATQGVQLLGNGRVSVLQRDVSAAGVQTAWRVIAITGATTVRQDSDVILHLQSLAAQMSIPQSLMPEVIPWISTAAVSGTPAAAHADQSSLHDLPWFGAVGVCELAVLPLLFSNTSHGSQHTLILVIELFETRSRPSDSRVRVVLEETQLALQTLDADAARRKTGHHRSRWKIVLSLLAAALLLLIPVNFTIEASGQLFPKERRRLFAPDQGIVEELLVSADEAVEAGQVLLRLRNAEHDLELNRLLGEFDSARTRLQAIRTSRSISSGPGSSGRSTDLSGDEQQWQQRLKNLDEEITLQREQIAALTITAPIRGIVYQRRLQERLTGRPVQRGQLLLELIQISGDWQLELQIPDAAIGYLPSAVRSRTYSDGPQYSVRDHSTGIEFVMPSAPGFRFSTTLDHVDAAVHLHQGVLSCTATAAVTDLPLEFQQPGSAVTASIHCGRRSLGFVWFREVIEFWQRKKFSWL